MPMMLTVLSLLVLLVEELRTEARALAAMVVVVVLMVPQSEKDDPKPREKDIIYWDWGSAPPPRYTIQFRC